MQREVFFLRMRASLAAPHRRGEMEVSGEKGELLGECWSGLNAVGSGVGAGGGAWPLLSQPGWVQMWRPEMVGCGGSLHMASISLREEAKSWQTGKMERGGGGCKLHGHPVSLEAKSREGPPILQERLRPRQGRVSLGAWGSAGKQLLLGTCG